MRFRLFLAQWLGDKIKHYIREMAKCIVRTIIAKHQWFTMSEEG